MYGLRHVRSWIGRNLCFLGTIFGLLVLATGPASAAPLPSPPQTKVVPDLGVDGSKTVADVKTKINEKWGVNKYKVVSLVTGDTDGLIAEQQQPAPGKFLTEGELMHIYVGGSGGGGFFEDVKVLQTIVVVELIVILVGWFWCRAKAGGIKAG